MKPISIPKNSRNFSRDNLCSGALPSKIIFGLVNSEALHGKDSKNPFNFQHFNISSVQFQVESVDFPYKPFETNFSANNYTEAYFSHFPVVNIVCIVYFEYQNMIEINKNRQVIFDYNIK
jgi:hypothetical protein